MQDGLCVPSQHWTWPPEQPHWPSCHEQQPRPLSIRVEGSRSSVGAQELERAARETAAMAYFIDYLVGAISILLLLAAASQSA
jgi:hypothetical protein